MFKKLFGNDVEIRFRPSFFPFTEPSVEVDMKWKGRWLEMGGAGLVNPKVGFAVGAIGADPACIGAPAVGIPGVGAGPLMETALVIFAAIPPAAVAPDGAAGPAAILNRLRAACHPRV
jgi:hypothetical protein